MMNNKESLKFFEGIIKKNSDNGAEKLRHDNDNSIKDAAFILKYANSDSEVLDIASGSGLIVNKIESYVKHVIAVEPFAELTKYIKESAAITIVNKNVFDLELLKQFDVVTLFGFMHYLNREEAKKIYIKCLDFLKPSGKIIIKNQFGIADDVTINGYSEVLKRDYYANYRQINKEIDLLKEIGYKMVEYFDIYPPECNRWDNTHFYAIVAGK